jgi:hypothetical protein
MRRLISLSRAACVIRFHLDHGWGWLRVALATADAYFYASLIYLVVSVAFERGGSDRYFLITLGVISLRWTLACLAAADTVWPLAALMARESRAAHLYALIFAMAAPTLVYLGSLGGLVVLTQLPWAGENSLAGIVWYPVLFVIHLNLNIAAVLVTGLLLRRGWLTSTAPVLIAATLVWFVSPVMYRFDDLQQAGTALLTTWSPGSHIIAAYHNCFWFGQPFSLEVLPATGMIAILVSASLLLIAARRPGSDGQVPVPMPSGNLTLVIDPQQLLDADGGAAAAAVGWIVHRPIRRAPRGLSGLNWVRLCYALRRPDRDGDFPAFRQRIETGSGIGDLFGRAMTLYPEVAADRLAVAIALEDVADRRTMLFHLFDTFPRDQVPEWWARLQESCGAHGSVAVISHRLLAPGEGAAGNFLLLRRDASPVSGSIADNLSTAYAAALDISTDSGPADQSMKSS